jgi:hypothetical protein
MPPVLNYKRDGLPPCGPLPRSLATEANGCLKVGIPHGSNPIQGRGASVARDGGLPSDLLNVLTAASDYLKPKKSGRSAWPPDLLSARVPLGERTVLLEPQDARQAGSSRASHGHCLTSPAPFLAAGNRSHLECR